MDLYTRIVLTVIALSLLAIAVRDVDLLPVARAANSTCQLPSRLEVEITKMPNLDWPAGTWSGKPIYTSPVK